MLFGIVFPGGEALQAAEFAVETERAGWDGFFVWDPVWGVDPWISLTAAAMRTERIRLGTMITPASRRRPWKLAGETATLDRLSNGRVILSVGLGAIDTGFVQFGEVTDRKQRAELLDESLEIITGLWRGQPYNFNGKHYHVKETTFAIPPPPIQQPRIPIWVVGAWPRPRSMQRALRYDGLLPARMDSDGQFVKVTPEDIIAIREYIKNKRAAGTHFDIVMEGNTRGDDPARVAAEIVPYAQAGITWWLESFWTQPDLERVRARILQGPPSLPGL